MILEDGARIGSGVGNSEWRRQRLSNAITKLVALDSDDPNIINANLSPEEMPQAFRLINWAIFSFYMDILRNGQMGEVEEASRSFEDLRRWMHPPVKETLVFSQVDEALKKHIGETGGK